MTVYQYDINSAYASVYGDLPCLIHGRWVPIRPGPRLPSAGVFVADVSFHHRKRLRWNTLPIRSERGTLLFPRTGRGWYWSPELRVAAKWADLTIHKGWKYVRQCDCRYFDFVYDMYRERDAAGKDSGKGKVLKTALATVYGKLAQSKGHPVFSNPIWSGLVVSSCRATLISAALQKYDGADVVMLATDGLFCTSPRMLSVGKAIGEWTLTKHRNIFIVQSGLYLLADEKPKTRGVPQSKVIEYSSKLRDIWRAFCENGLVDVPPSLVIPLRNFISARLAHARGKTWQAGRWVIAPKRVRFEWQTKRCDPEIHGERVDTWPVEGSDMLVSQSPSWMIGGRYEWSDEMDDQPDWGDVMTRDDDWDMADVRE